MRVVNVSRVFWSSPYSEMSNPIPTPSLRPIQLVCIVLIFSGHSSFEWSSSSSAYFVMRKNHWLRSRCVTAAPHLSQWPSSTTCSLARTVLHEGHQLAGAWSRYARPAL